ncbi:MAG TPA: class I adenylate-forming enzyme family protein [Sphingomicrobium sp.]|jgi:acyl-CoA synthetase (AMP-forming)/AMP-acid ligase II|nr:class I adenylate-forming enzyme family protein [Sphingomicrobium sp.]
MRSELDRRFDEELDRVIGPGGRVVIVRDELGRAIARNFPSTLPDFFRTFCALNAGAEALVAGAERFTFAELDALSDEIAHGLAARGIQKGDRVGIAMRNCPAWILAYMGVLKAGGIATLLNGWWQPSEMEHAILLADPKLIIADAARAKRIVEKCSGRDILSVKVELPARHALSELVGDCDGPLPEISPEDDATILFTSGSTGLCKGALSTHLAVATGVYSYATGLIVLRALLEEEGRPPPTPRTLLSVPLFHVTGEVPVLLNSFAIGRSMVIMPKWDVLEALRLIEKERITYFVGVPTMSLELMNHPDRGQYDLSSLTDITAGGAPRPVSHVERLTREFPHAHPALGYGLTETNAVGCQNFWSNYAAKPNSTGRAARPFVEVAILGEDDRKLEVGEIGEIAIRSAANIKGYWLNPLASEELFTTDGFVKTGDVGYLDEDKYLFIVDRKKEIIIRGGENISAAEVEAELYACPKIAEVSVFGAADERLGEVPVAIVLATDGEELDEEGLRTFLDGRLAKFKIPERIIFVDAPLPRLGTGKIDRRALKAKYAR